MKILTLEWDGNNVEHIARHAVKPHEAEEACSNDPLILRGPRERHYVHSRTNAGRHLFLVIHYLGSGQAYVITARDMTETEKWRYCRKK